MSDLIDRDSLRGKLAYADFKNISDWQKINELIDNQPKVDLVKHGHWIAEEPFKGWWHCSECNAVLEYHGKNLSNREKYCYSCGCKMDEVTG